MALVKGRDLPENEYTHGRLPPPSSILATHIAPINGNALPDVDPKIFAQLIEECLGYDEDSDPRVGTDAAINHRLICVIIKAGIDPASIDPDDPFKSQGRDYDQVARCLDVIDLAIRRSPLVVYALSGPDDLGPEDHNVPLFIWLIPKLLWLLGESPNEHGSVSSKSWSVLRNLVASSRICSISQGECEVVPAYIASCASGRDLFLDL
jgi:serine/threonine-protein kinase ATR